MKISDKQKVYNLERKLEKCKQMISVLQRSTCTATAATREKASLLRGDGTADFVEDTGYCFGNEIC